MNFQRTAEWVRRTGPGRRNPLSWLPVCLLLTAITAAQAQNFPNRPLRIISPFAAGGSNDVVARLISAKLGEMLGQQVIVENRPGAGGVVGTEFGARAAPDGYTLIMVSNATLCIAPALGKIPYEPLRDFAPVGPAGSSPYVVVVHPAVPVRTIQQLIALVKARPEQVEFGSGGIGTPGHLAGEMLNTMTGARMVHIPYKAGNLALNDLLGGHIAVTFSNTSTASELIKAGRVRALAATSATRIGAFPDLPTVAESGVPGYEFSLWLGLALPAATSSAIVQQLNASLARLLQDKILHERFAAQSIEVLSSTPQDFTEKIKRDMGIYAKLVKNAGARPE